MTGQGAKYFDQIRSTQYAKLRSYSVKRLKTTGNAKEGTM